MTTTEPTKDHSRVSPEGRAIGAMLVRLVEKNMAEMVAGGDTDDRCKSCAFRAGTVPNGCIQTMRDATKAVLEQVPFGCHVNTYPDGSPARCAGWDAAMWGAADRPIVQCPWEFSPPDNAKASPQGATPNDPHAH